MKNNPTRLKRSKKIAFFVCVLPLSVLASLSLRLTKTVTADENLEAAPKTALAPEVQVLLAGIKNREASLKSANGYFVKEVYNTNDSEVQNAPSEEVVRDSLKQAPWLSQLFWAADGVEVREDEKVISPASESGYRLAAYDGERLQVWDFGKPRAAEYFGSDAAAIPVGQIDDALQLPLGKDAASSSQSQQIERKQVRFIGKEQIAGVETYKIESLLQAGDASIDAWWIAPSRGYVVLKHEFRSAKPNPGERIASWRHVEVVDRLLKVSDDLWVPTSARHIVYLTLKTEPKVEKWATVYRVTALSLKINEPIAPETFQLPLPIGTGIGSKQHDIIVVGGDISEFEAQAQKGQPDAKALLDAPNARPNLPGDKTP